MKFMEFNEKKADQICAALSEGELLIEYCLSKKDSKDMKKEKRGRPHTIDVFKWLETEPEFAADYKLARVNQATSLAERALMIVSQKANDSTEATMLKAKSESLRWMSSKMDRNTFGDSQRTQEPVQIVVKTSLGDDSNSIDVGRTYKATATAAEIVDIAKNG